MKIFALAAAFALSATAAMAAEPIQGLWQTQPDEGAFAFVDIKPCGPAYCGTIVKTFKGKEEYKSPNIGKQIVRSMAPKGDGTYAGQVWRPSNDKVYTGTAVVNGKSMKLTGCIVRPLCSTQTWTKLK